MTKPRKKDGDVLKNNPLRIRRNEILKLGVGTRTDRSGVFPVPGCGLGLSGGIRHAAGLPAPFPHLYHPWAGGKLEKPPRRVRTGNLYPAAGGAQRAGTGRTGRRTASGQTDGTGAGYRAGGKQPGTGVPA